LTTVYLGTSEFAASVLRTLAASRHRPALVVSRPDAPQGRGRRLRPPPAAAAATELGLELYQPVSVNDDASVARIAQAGGDADIVVCVCAFGALIKEPLLSADEMLNVHPSLLPRWRGAAPVERAIMAGDAVTGVCIMQVTAGLDSGPVCLRAHEPIAAGDTYGSLAPRLAHVGGHLLVQALDLRAAGELTFAEQDEAGATYAEKIAPEDRRLDPGGRADELERRVRALTPHIGAYLETADGTRLGVQGARAIDDGAVPAGELSLAGARPVFGCAVGALELTVVQPPGKRPMPAEDYLRGHRR
jgi:methionyl-tRNA formyltransferase